MLTGRNHHSVGFGSITEFATSAPGYNAIRPNNKATIPEVLRLNGYSTAHFGKSHEVPPWETSPIGPFDRWPTGAGFEKFCGFVGGDTHKYAPALIDGTAPIEPPDDPDYHLSEDLADRTASWMRQQAAFAPDKPFFVDGAEVASGRTERSIPYIISLDETLDVGTDAGTPVTDDYPARGNEFNGTISQRSCVPEGRREPPRPQYRSGALAADASPLDPPSASAV